MEHVNINKRALATWQNDRGVVSKRSVYVIHRNDDRFTFQDIMSGLTFEVPRSNIISINYRKG